MKVISILDSDISIELMDDLRNIYPDDIIWFGDKRYIREANEIEEYFYIEFRKCLRESINDLKKKLKK